MVIQSRPLHLLLTRPRLQGMRFARQLRNSLHQPLRITLSPLIQPVFLHPAMPAADFHAVIFTSETGVATAASYADLPKLAYCVGDQTARAARRAGFVTRSAAGDAAALVHMVLQTAQPQPLLHICGTDTRGDVAERLNSAGIETQVLVTYRQDAAQLTPAAQRLLSRNAPIVVPLFSPRTARIFATQAAPIAHAPLYIAAFSPAVARAINGLLITGLETAVEPTAKAMIAAIQQIADRNPVA
jgi:uroporphyrinogen-III synthase